MFAHSDFAAAGSFLLVAAAVGWKLVQRRRAQAQLARAVRSVNYHVTRQCNYRCRFCFHTSKSSKSVTLGDAKKVLRELAEHGMQKINFAGGEPLLKAEFVGELCKFCKQDLGLAVSIVTNASKLTDEWLAKFGRYIDIIAVSCDSGVNETNREIGRCESDGKGVEQVRVLRFAAALCAKHNIKFKINTVVCALNVREDMNWLIEELRPVRWKVFQVLPIEGENFGDGALRDVRNLLITAEEFASYIKRHESQQCLVVESNDVMRNSYFLIDEELRILDNGGGSKRPTPSILDVGLVAAFNGGVAFDSAAFDARDGGYYTSMVGSPGDIEDL